MSSSKSWKAQVLFWWFRLKGLSTTQAEWQVRQALSKEKSPTINRHHFRCLCGQFLSKGTSTCHECGRRQWIPFWYHQLIRSQNQSEELKMVPLFALLCLLGYAAQLMVTQEGLMAPFPSKPEEHYRALMAYGAWFPDHPRVVYFANLLFAQELSLQQIMNIPHQSWRLLSYSFLHGGLMHLGFNLYALYQIGQLIERTFGAIRVGWIWLISSAGAVYLPALLFQSTHPVVGASGAIFGLIGVAMVYGHRVGTPQGRYIRNKMIEWTVICTLFGMMMGGVAHSAHFGGLISGGILALFLSPPKKTIQHLLNPFLTLFFVLTLLWMLYSGYQFYILIS